MVSSKVSTHSVHYTVHSFDWEPAQQLRPNGHHVSLPLRSALRLLLVSIYPRSSVYIVKRRFVFLKDMGTLSWDTVVSDRRLTLIPAGSPKNWRPTRLN
jgi:hypothetical protein